jgi:release factor glutamine methyltransferase
VQARPAVPPAPFDDAASPRRRAARLTTVREAIDVAASRFAFSATARLDAELLMAHALGVERQAMLLGKLGEPAPADFAAMVERRAAHEPVAYITGTRGFWTIDVSVGPGVLVPRADSETLIEAAIDHFGARSPRTILDLGTGSGALLLAALMEWPEARGIGVDASPEALRIAAGNVERLGLTSRAELHRGDWDALDGRYDLILCNPPYIATGAVLPAEVRDHEPASALFAGMDGLDDYRRIAPLVADRLAPDGVACIEIGSDQGDTAASLFRAQSLHVALRQDLGRRNRCLVVTP